MVKAKRSLDDIVELVKKTDVNEIEITGKIRDILSPTNTGRRKAEGHIRGHMVKGYVYYYYIRGTDKEIYLGTAGHILSCVNKVKND